MPDSAHRWTDKQIWRLSNRLGRVYGRAHSEMRSKYKKSLEEYAKERARRIAALDGSKQMQRDFDKWCERQVFTIVHERRTIEQLAHNLTETDAKARAIANGALPAVYAHNYNYGTRDISRQLSHVKGSTGISFSLVDEPTVKMLMTENPRLLPIPKTVQEGTREFAQAVAYNRRHVTTAITQGILQGESIPDIAKRMAVVYGKSADAAARYARTACTYAENAGRLRSYHDAEELGISLKKKWIATGDDRTRDSHLEADGQTVDIDEPFIVGGSELMEPGDPSGDSSEVWNCRCTMRAVVESIKPGATPHANEIDDERLRRQWT